jgi:hypothetical protein
MKNVKKLEKIGWIDGELLYLIALRGKKEFEFAKNEKKKR